MIDLDALMRDFLTADLSLATRVMGRGAWAGSPNIFAGASLPPAFTVGEHGPAVLFNIRGGGQDFSGHVLEPSYQFRSYGASEREAREVDRLLFEAINDKQYKAVLWARLETLSQLIIDRETQWVYALSFYRALIRN